MPTVWSYAGNIVFFPGGTTGKRAPFYVTGGIGSTLLAPRVPTKVFGYDVDTVGTQMFMTENIGGGIKLFRGADAPNWGFRTRLPVPVRELERRRTCVLRQIDEPRRAPDLCRNAIYLEEIEPDTVGVGGKG